MNIRTKLRDLFADKRIRIRIKKIGEEWFCEVFHPRAHQNGKFFDWGWYLVGYDAETGQVQGFPDRAGAVSTGEAATASLKFQIQRTEHLHSQKGWTEIDATFINPAVPCPPDCPVHGPTDTTPSTRAPRRTRPH